MFDLHLTILAQASEQDETGLLGVVLWVLLGVLLAAAVAVNIRDLLRLSATRLWALAAQTVRESIRRRVLLLIPGAMLLIVVIGLFQRSFNEVGQINQATETCIRVAGGLTMLLMIVLAAFAFPREFETRTIYSLMTKPVSRVEVFLGKVLGLWIVAGVVLVLMGAFSYGYLHVRAATLTRQATARLDEQQQRYDRFVHETSATTRPGELSASRVRPDPPDASLREQLDMGLLRAANYVDAPRVDLHPVIPPTYLDRQPARQWMLTRRGYVANYVFNLPPVSQREHDYKLEMALDIPASAKDDTIQANLRLHVPRLTPEAMQSRVQAWQPPRALAALGWSAGVGEVVNVTLKHEHVGLWLGETMLSGGFLRGLGPVEQLGITVEVPTRYSQMVGLLAAGGQAPGMLLTPVEGGRQAGEGIWPAQLIVLPRSQAIQRFALSGTEPNMMSEVAEYRFEQLPMDKLPDGDLVFLLRFAVDKGSPIGVDTKAEVTVSGSGQQHRMLVLPSARLGCYVRVPRELARDGAIVLTVRPQQPEDTFTLSADSVRLVARGTGFALNLSKSLVIIGLAAMVVVAIGVMASVFLSWPVAMLLNGVVLIAGSLLDLVRGMLTTPGGVNVFQVSGADKSHDVLVQVGNVTVTSIARVVQHVVPDFTNFDPVAFIGQGLNIPVTSIAIDAAAAGVYLCVAIAIGVLMLRFREVAK